MENVINGIDNFSEHPCLSCGACCNFYKVQFHKTELIDVNYLVPKEYTVDLLNTTHLAMKGTNKKDPRCMALKGVVGQNVACSIYEHRPSCCREFTASYENGIKNERCDKARMAKNLEPLYPTDWERFRQSYLN